MTLLLTSSYNSLMVVYTHAAPWPPFYPVPNSDNFLPNLDRTLPKLSQYWSLLDLGRIFEYT